jgi:MFS family permease
MLDSNIVAVSLPSIGRSLGASFSDIEWVVSAYLISDVALLMGAGAYVDLNGNVLSSLLAHASFSDATFGVNMLVAE